MHQETDITIEELNADSGRIARQQEAAAISHKYQAQLVRHIPAIDFVGQLEDCKGELWAFTAKNDYIKRQHGFDVYSWKVDDLESGGARWMGQVGDNLLIIPKPKQELLGG